MGGTARGRSTAVAASSLGLRFSVGETALLNRDRALRPERRLRTARIAADSPRDERILPGSERACARELPRGHGSRQPPPRAPAEEQPRRLVRPRDRVIDRVAADLLGLIL